MSGPYILYGMPASLYTAKVRAYLARRRIPFEERTVGHPRFRETVLPAVGRFIMPVVETPGGAFWQDGTEIIDRLEEAHPNDAPPVPEEPVLGVLAHLLALFGGEGLVRPAMHFRWNFDETNLAFLEKDFAAALAPPGASAEERRAVFDLASGKMRAATASFGVNEKSAPLIEASFEELLGRLEAHFADHPFLLGGRPTAADDGLLGPLSAHLGRDPYPSALMKEKAPLTFGWTERMGSPGTAADGPLFGPRALPDSLLQILRFVAEDYLPEIRAHVRFTEDWLADRPDLQPGETGVDKRSRRVIGKAAIAWHGTTIDIVVAPYRLWLLQRMQDAFDAAPEEDRTLARSILETSGLEELLDLRTSRRVERADNMEVWGPLRR